MKNEFLPSLLSNLYKTDSRTTTWDEVCALIRNDAFIQEQTERFRATRADRDKHALPCITPAVQLNGTGKGTADVAGLTGFTLCDIDHVPTERVEEVRAAINASPYTFLSHLSLSGNGFHIIARYDNALDYETAFLLCNAHYADLAELNYDEQCINLNRTFLLCHDPQAYYNPSAKEINYELINRQDNRELHTLELVRLRNNVEQEFHELAIQDENNNKKISVIREIRGCEDRKRWVKVAKDKLQAAVDYVEKTGCYYVEHNRHTYLVNCVFHMNKLGVPRVDVERWISSFDRPERERRSIVRSIYDNHAAEFGIYEAPYEWTLQPDTSPSACTLAGSFHAHTGAREADEEALRPEFYVQQFPDYQWPPFIQQMLACADSKPQRDVMLLGIFTVLGSLLGRKVKIKYSRRFWYPSLQVFVVAPPASGKSVISWVRHLAEPFHDTRLSKYEAAKKCYDQEKVAYDTAGRERANMPIPQPPVMSMFLIAGNNSSTGILENLADAQGWALICESEADTLSAAINADYGNWDDTLRRTHDHDRLSYNRRTNKEYRQIQSPCMGVLICGTPAQVKPLIPSAENGLFSRQLFATLPAVNEFVDQFGDDELDVDSQFYQWGQQWLEVYKGMTGITSVELRLGKEQREQFVAHFSQLFNHANVTQAAHHMKSSVVREAVNILRIMMVVAFFRAVEVTPSSEDGKPFRINRELFKPAKDVPAENVKDGVCTRYDLTITEDDFQAVMALSEPLYRTACDILTLLPSTEAQRQPISAMQQLLSSLPMQFTYADALELSQALNIPKGTLDTRLKRLREKGHLRCIKTGVYVFTKGMSLMP